eukprot:COSAG04_NODE_434_length_14479_cov_52.278164_11_plen_55_part_00
MRLSSLPLGLAGLLVFSLPLLGPSLCPSVLLAPHTTTTTTTHHTHTHTFSFRTP